MLEKPAIADQRIIGWVREEYGLRGVEVRFLPLGADQNTAVYRAVAGDGVRYLIKLRRGAFHEASVALPRFLADQGVDQIIPPLATETGELWAERGEFKVILYPFVEGRDGYEVSLTQRQWMELGRALHKIHTTTVPPHLGSGLRQETYDAHARDSVRAFVKDAERGGFLDPVAAQVSALLQTRRRGLLDLVARAERLAQTVQTRRLQHVVCHSDLHAGNVLISRDGRFYLVDWDDPILAPKERDLMYVGGGLMGRWRPPEEEEALFYQGYGAVEVDRAALAYYRYERIVQDIAAFCEQLLERNEGREDRERSLGYLMSNWDPGGVIEIAYRSDGT